MSRLFSATSSLEPHADANPCLIHAEITAREQRLQRVVREDFLVAVAEVQKHRTALHDDAATDAKQRLGAIEQTERAVDERIGPPCSTESRAQPRKSAPLTPALAADKFTY